MQLQETCHSLACNAKNFLAAQNWHRNLPTEGVFNLCSSRIRLNENQGLVLGSFLELLQAQHVS